MQVKSADLHNLIILHQRSSTTTITYWFLSQHTLRKWIFDLQQKLWSLYKMVASQEDITSQGTADMFDWFSTDDCQGNKKEQLHPNTHI